MDVFINDMAVFLPNRPVGNEQIEGVLGCLNDTSLKIKRIVLKSNQIKTRHYALDPATGRLTHTNAQLTARAVEGLHPYEGFSVQQIQCLACGTSSPDLLFPGHALMVCGELGLAPCEAISTAGICLAGMSAFKYAWMNVVSGMSENAVATGSELASSLLRAAFMKPIHNETSGEALEREPLRAFDADFLRWMLSDGAGAAFLSNRPNGSGISLRVDWIETLTFSGELPTCMYGGGVQQPDGGIVGWRDEERITPDQRAYLFAIRQDIKLLDQHIVDTMSRALSATISKHALSPDAVDWFVPHYSSAYFRPRFYEEMKRIGFEIPYERWFTNLSEKGNTGGAAIFIILEELFSSGRLKTGEKLLCFIPESGRFSHCFMMLTVV
jgi:3-oxoacyl-[acyl-carrier-protein] synthase III